MHEEALLSDLRRKLGEIAEREHVVRIARVRLWVGALAHVPEPALRRRWEAVVRGTAAEGSALEVETSTDLSDPRAGGLVLVGVDVEDGAPTGRGAPGSDELIRGRRPSGGEER